MDILMHSKLLTWLSFKWLRLGHAVNKQLHYFQEPGPTSAENTC